MFSEKGTITKINYRDCFKQYKKFIVKNIEAPRMKALMARLNAKIFQVYPPDDQAAPSSTVGQEEGEDDDDFARAFQEEITLGTYHSLLSPLSQNI
jgi:hypothetical protein